MLTVIKSKESTRNSIALSRLSIRRVCFGLASFLSKRRVVKLTQTPKEFFVNEQICLVAYEFLIRTRKKVLTKADISDNVENIFELILSMLQKSIFAAHLGAALSEEMFAILWEIMEAYDSSGPWQRSFQLLREAVENVLPARDSYILLPSLENFRDHTLIGQGGFGTIYKTSFDQIPVALKIIRQRKLVQYKCLSHDKAASCMLEHPRIVTMHASFRCSGGYLLLMEAVEGLDLYRLIHCFRNLSNTITRYLTAQVVSAILYMHLSGFIHKDVKPSNIIIMTGCALKLCDFDTCKVSIGKYPVLRASRNFNRRTPAEFNDTLFNGTVSYAAPEILEQSPYGRAADWWSVGLTNYHMFCGSSPFRFPHSVSRQQMSHVLRTYEIVYPVWTSGATDFLDFSRLLLNHDPQTRLGSKSYREIVEHKYFSGIPWNIVDAAGSVLHDEQIETMLEKRKEVSLEILKKKRRKRVINLSEMEDHLEQYPLYTFVSKDFQRKLSILYSKSI